MSTTLSHIPLFVRTTSISATHQHISLFDRTTAVAASGATSGSFELRLRTCAKAQSGNGGALYDKFSEFADGATSMSGGGRVGFWGREEGVVVSKSDKDALCSTVGSGVGEEEGKVVGTVVTDNEGDRVSEGVGKVVGAFSIIGKGVGAIEGIVVRECEELSELFAKELDRCGAGE